MAEDNNNDPEGNIARIKKSRDNLRKLKAGVSPALYRATLKLISWTAFSRMILSCPLSFSRYYIGKIAHPENFLGLSDGAIICPGQLHIIDEKTGDLTLETANAGEFVAYDFSRPLRKSRQNRLSKGKIYSFELDNFECNPRNTLTPPKFVDFTDIEMILSFDAPSLDYLLQNEFVTSTNLERVFDKQGLLSLYEKELYINGIAAKQVYEVTPKANTRLFLRGRAGEKDPHPSMWFFPSLEPVRTP